MEGFRFSDLVQGRRRLLVQAKVGRVDDQGAFEVEEVERVEVDREDQSPLLLTAARGGGTGAQGKRTVRLEGGVTIQDDDSNLGLEIPAVEINQVDGWVRSVGAVKLTSEAWKGTAGAVDYSLLGEGNAHHGPRARRTRRWKAGRQDRHDRCGLEGPDARGSRRGVSERHGAPRRPRRRRPTDPTDAWRA